MLQNASSVMKAFASVRFLKFIEHRYELIISSFLQTISKLQFNETINALLSVKYLNIFSYTWNHEQRTYGAVIQDSPRWCCLLCACHKPYIWIKRLHLIFFLFSFTMEDSSFVASNIPSPCVAHAAWMYHFREVILCKLIKFATSNVLNASIKKIMFKMLRMICNVYSKFHFLTKLYFFLSISISLLGRSCLLAMTTTGTPLILLLFKNPKSFSRDSNILSLSLLSTTYTHPAVKKYCLRLLYLNMELYPPPLFFFTKKKKNIKVQDLCNGNSY